MIRKSIYIVLKYDELIFHFQVKYNKIFIFILIKNYI